MHPLDPLTEEEISQTARVVKAKYGDKFNFNSICLKEPLKSSVVLLHDNDDSFISIPRLSFTILIEKETGRVIEALVNLTQNDIEEWKEVGIGNQPTLTPEDCFDAEKIVKEDEKVKARCMAAGYPNMNFIVADPWSIGYSPLESETFNNKRLVQLFMYARESPEDNHYAHPLDFVTIVDLIGRCVVRIDDLPAHGEFNVRSDKRGISIPSKCHNYDPMFHPHGFHRDDLKPLKLTSPQGPSFTVKGNLVEWQKFSFRVGFNYREGLVLQNVYYKDGPNIRPLFYRASIAEMVVPYGDPRPPFHRKAAFDVGDYGLGFCANSLKLGCDCFGEITYFDAVMNNHVGEAVVLKNAICLHEEDAGLLWKHTEYRTGKACSVRSRRLVLSFIATVVNYEYGFYWYFHQDGTIEFEVKATGELSTNLIAEGGHPFGHGTIVAPFINAQFHQHIFAVRIDPMIDGRRNSVIEVDVMPLELGKENPHGQGFGLKKTIFRTAKEGCTQTSPGSGRNWLIVNPRSLNPITGEPVGWKLMPGNTQPLLARPGSIIRERAAFATHGLWVTAFKEGQIYPAGFYVNQSKGGDGLPAWIKANPNEKIEEEDLVLWHTFGLTHIPRVEDFPIMPIETCGFVLKPNNFFESNPSLDVPPSAN